MSWLWRSGSGDGANSVYSLGRGRQLGVVTLAAFPAVTSIEALARPAPIHWFHLTERADECRFGLSADGKNLSTDEVLPTLLRPDELVSLIQHDASSMDWKEATEAMSELRILASDMWHGPFRWAGGYKPVYFQIFD